MKKLLSILGVIGLTATSTTTLISCEKPNNNENGGGVINLHQNHNNYQKIANELIFLEHRRLIKNF
ncbi:lipoprotein [Spiroplasma endosymbiont of Sarcophaga carnaria]|uniref:lipoprotein n=1 Tax=Spiroplasma endosymbiont of Sarcophaga carnaria TaxID=3066303 RepID=UPI0030CAEBAF